MKPQPSQRLRFASWAFTDLADAIELWGDRKVMQYIDFRGGLSREQVEQKLQQEIEREKTFGIQYWKIALNETGETVGCCGLRPYAPNNRVIEIGFHIKRRYWGRGYATEAAKAVIDHAFKELNAAKLFAGHNPNNRISRALLSKLGFKYIGDQFYEPTGLNHPSYELTTP